jgi:NAD(P)-dependent dehydrogenase (short-subunit alcohol dehydrogenase family)
VTSTVSTTSPGRVAGKVAIVTGGGDGIGRGISLRLAEQGAAVAIFDIAGDTAAGVADEIAAHGGHATALTVDVTQEAQVAAAVEVVVRQFGTVDILVNNAAIPGVNKPAHEATEADFTAVFDVNVKGVFLCTKHVIQHLLTASHEGSIINISSISGLVGNHDLPLYHATKGAVRLMAKTDAVVYAKHGIRVNSIHPGSIRTPLSEKAAEGYPDGPEAYFQMWRDLHPLGRQGEPDDIAYGVIYLASDESKFVTGSELVIDGGYTAQ